MKDDNHITKRLDRIINRKRSQEAKRKRAKLLLKIAKKRNKKGLLSIDARIIPPCERNRLSHRLKDSLYNIFIYFLMVFIVVPFILVCFLSSCLFRAWGIVKRILSKLHHQNPHKKIGPSPSTEKAPKKTTHRCPPKGFATGGLVPQNDPNDARRVMISPGYMEHSEDAINYYGLSFFNAINGNMPTQTTAAPPTTFDLSDPKYWWYRRNLPYTIGDLTDWEREYFGSCEPPKPEEPTDKYEYSPRNFIGFTESKQCLDLWGWIAC